MAYLPKPRHAENELAVVWKIFEMITLLTIVGLCMMILVRVGFDDPSSSREAIPSFPLPKTPYEAARCFDAFAMIAESYEHCGQNIDVCPTSSTVNGRKCMAWKAYDRLVCQLYVSSPLDEIREAVQELRDGILDFLRTIEASMAASTTKCLAADKVDRAFYSVN